MMKDQLRPDLCILTGQFREHLTETYNEQSLSLSLSLSLSHLNICFSYLYNTLVVLYALEQTTVITDYLLIII